MLSGHRRAVPRHQSDEMKIPREGGEPKTNRFYSYTLCTFVSAIVMETLLKIGVKPKKDVPASLSLVA